MKIGIIGLGIMGGAFSRNLLKAGFEVAGYDIDEKRVNALVEAGGHAAASAFDAAEIADVVITSLPSVAAFHDAVSGPHGLAQAEKKGLIVIEASTLPIAEKEKGRKALKEAGGILLDCPVSGTGAQAAKGDLAVYASGDKKAYDKAKSVFDGFARSHRHVGPFGDGSKLKFVANHLVHIHNVASAEAMVLGMKAGLDPSLIYEVIADGAGTSRIFELRGPMMAKGDYEPATMKMGVWQKDMDVIGAFAESVECPVPLFQACLPMYAAALAHGMDSKDTAGVCAVLEEMAGLKPRGVD